MSSVVSTYAQKPSSVIFFFFVAKRAWRTRFVWRKRIHFKTIISQIKNKQEPLFEKNGCWMCCTTWFTLVLKAFYTILKSWLCWRARKLTNNYRSIVWDNEGFLQMAFNTQIWLNVQARNKCYQMCWTECSILIEWYWYDFDFELCNCHFHRNFI